MNRFPYPENDPSYVPVTAAQVFVPTGRNAQRSVAALQANYQKDPEAGKDIFFPLETRQARRFHKAEEKRQTRRGRRAYVRRELAKERAASDLANLFALRDGQGPPIAPRMRASVAINARIKYLLAEGDGTKTWDEVEAQLRDIAATATLPSPKVRTA